MTDQLPTYEQATGSSSASQRLQVPERQGSIPPSRRRSMEDEGRELPTGWIRQYDPKQDHHYYVDTKANPPRSIWHHPYDDVTYLRTLSTEERERLEELQLQHPSRDDIIGAESDTDNPHYEPELPPRPGQSSTGEHPHGLRKYGRKLKDKLTDTTHDQRVAERDRREREDVETYRRHMMIRRAMQAAWETGQPQFLGKDREGHDVFLEPPRGGPFQTGGAGYNLYSQGPYQQPNARFIPYPEPSYPYARPYGSSYGYGMGLPIMGGLLGGAMLGSVLF